MYKKILLLLLLGNLVFITTKAQFATADEKEIEALLYKNAAALHVSADDLKNTRISSFYYDENNGITMVYLQQTYKGVDVYNAISPVAFKNGKPVAVKMERANVEESIANKNEKPAVAAFDALRTAVSDLHLPLRKVLALVSMSGNKHEYEFEKPEFSYNNVFVHLLWMPAGDATHFDLGWMVNIQLAKNNENWVVKIDAQKGNVVTKENVTVSEVASARKDALNFFGTQATESNRSVESVESVSSASFKVIPYPFADPSHTSPTLVSDPWNAFGSGNKATTLKWNSIGATDFDSTRGNNVYAQPDLDGKNATQNNAARSTTALPNLTFNYTPDFNIDPLQSANNRNFAITNLFYWNNIMHDMSYQYGFTEVAGNFQQNNLSRGGKGADYVIADGLDASGTNNANFATPIKDGSKPRMQMYLWSPSALKTKVLKINAPSSYAGLKMSSEGGFSKNNKLLKVGPVTGRVIAYNDQGNPTSHGACVSPGNAGVLAGKIAYIDRGGCNFTDKVLNAQNAGAIGVIIGDNVTAEIPPAMGGTNNNITIPAVSITLKDADSLKSFLLNKVLVNATLQADNSNPQLDGDIDNSIICHEFTHGISGRLTGGTGKTSYCLQDKEQMGEGWSDYMALMMTTDWVAATDNDGALPHPIGNYAFGLPPSGSGIRNYPYSTNFSINPWTYDSVAHSAVMASAEPHNIGEPWCEVLWDMTWDLIHTNGINRNFFDANGAGGNSVAVKLVLQGMKMQPCAVGFVSGRNAILAADTVLYGGQYSAVIWQAFASRGCGYSASEGSLAKVADDVAAYDLPPTLLVANTTAKVAAVGALTGAANVSVSPNPAHNIVTVFVAGNTKPLHVVMYSAAGQQVAAYVVQGTSKAIDVSSLARGTYYVSIAGEGINQKEKIIIQ